jgi:hypothetical protein
MIPRVGEAPKISARLQRTIEIDALIRRFHLWLPATRISDAPFLPGQPAG